MNAILFDPGQVKAALAGKLRQVWIPLDPILARKIGASDDNGRLAAAIVERLLGQSLPLTGRHVKPLQARHIRLVVKSVALKTLAQASVRDATAAGCEPGTLILPARPRGTLCWACRVTVKRDQS